MSLAPSPGPFPELTQTQVVAALQDLVEPARVLHSRADRAPYESDALTAFRAQPYAVVLANDPDEVVRLVRWCHATGVPFLARGSGTSLSGGSMPRDKGVVLALNRLNRILEIRPEDGLCRVEPGVINLRVSQAAQPYGLYYAPDPSSQPICTIGGNVAFNSGGAHCLKYGMTSNHVLGLKYVTPTGVVETAGRNSLEGLGPDLTGLFVGSEGRFGVALEITLRLLPLVPAYKTVLAAYASLTAAGEAVAQVVASGLLPGAMEIMDRLSIQAAEASVQAGYPQAAAILIVELEGEEEQVASDFAALRRLLQASGAHEIRAAQSEAERAQIWKGRKNAFSAVGRLSPDYIVQDGVVPRSRLGEALTRIEALSRQYDIRVANVFHAGDGNLHPLILFDGRAEGALHRAEELAGEILRMCIDMGGSITGEHGVGMEKRAYLPAMYQGRDLQFMYDLCFAMDPRGVANRGKMLVDEQWPPPALQARDDSAPAAYGAARRARVAALRAAVAAGSAWRIVGGGSKTRRAADDPIPALSATELTGILDYDPQEFTITALAGTPVQALQAALEEQGQYLPFCPPSQAGATLGGTLACGLSGEGRLRFGGARDFVLGVRFIDGQGRLIYSGGQVVKNAAGFDAPKLLVGSLGSLALMVEITLKVFPQAPAYGTLQCRFRDMEAACRQMHRIRTGPAEVVSLSLNPEDGEYALYVRLAGSPELLPQRLARLADFVAAPTHCALDDAHLWRALDEWSRLDAAGIWRVPIAPALMLPLERSLRDLPYARRYGMGGHLLWLRGEASPALDATLARFQLGGLGLRDVPAPSLRGVYPMTRFLARVKQVLDPDGKFASPLPYPAPDTP